MPRDGWLGIGLLASLALSRCPPPVVEKFRGTTPTIACVPAFAGDRGLGVLGPARGTGIEPTLLFA